MTDLHFPWPRQDPHEPGVLARWLAADGAPVRSGTAVAEVVTDGVRRTVRASASGTLWRQGAAGEHFAAGAVIGLIE
ncbi:biotin attachment protein [Saccharopolyspora gloriosae]|uniref:Pyruvate/2-oxoglutarate dehydrogenase complex dihydrolipoamide acyltransferase (E2) component n=1 Tax=Saccharopolyspora gloriosae TaxID=455344 RepID=A0A840NC97_9PSEU|nr:biotin attachment protein [Saccharopolyspora gloriosae]MBB5067745.1 pyruvate/2-oxoglutarate dehydrogenase complex dihydrolipoamide acyltransferase (E2) component [Saccharopolyspora gloriosae]